MQYIYIYIYIGVTKHASATCLVNYVYINLIHIKNHSKLWINFCLFKNKKKIMENDKKEMSCARECSLDQIDGARIVFSKKNNENNKCWKRISTKKGMIADQS